MIYRNYESLEAFEAEIAKYRTPPKNRTKDASFGNRSITAINDQWRADTLSVLFGPYGIGWWTESEPSEWRQFGSLECNFVKMRIVYRICIAGEEVTGHTGWHTGGTLANKAIDDIVKQSETDALGKAASHLGIAADIYLDDVDNKYTREELPPNNQQATQRSSERARPTRGPASDPGSVKVPFGSSKNRMISELSDKENRGTLQFMINKSMTGPFRDALEAWLESREASQVEDESVPF